MKDLFAAPPRCDFAGCGAHAPFGLKPPIVARAQRWCREHWTLQPSTQALMLERARDAMGGEE